MISDYDDLPKNTKQKSSRMKKTTKQNHQEVIIVLKKNGFAQLALIAFPSWRPIFQHQKPTSKPWALRART